MSQTAQGLWQVQQRSYAQSAGILKPSAGKFLRCSEHAFPSVRCHGRSSPLQLLRNSGVALHTRRFASSCVPSNSLQPRSYLSYVARVIKGSEAWARAQISVFLVSGTRLEPTSGFRLATWTAGLGQALSFLGPAQQCQHITTTVVGLARRFPGCVNYLCQLDPARKLKKLGDCLSFYGAKTVIKGSASVWSEPEGAGKSHEKVHRKDVKKAESIRRTSARW